MFTANNKIIWIMHNFILVVHGMCTQRVLSQF